MGQLSGAFLGIDLGTTNVKAQIVGPDGTILSSGSSPVSVRYSAGGGAEQDIEEIWTATQEAVRQASASGAGRQRPGNRRLEPGRSAAGAGPRRASRGPGDRLAGHAGAPLGRDADAAPGKAWFIEHCGHTKSDSAVGQLLRLREQGALPSGCRVGGLAISSWGGCAAAAPTMGRAFQRQACTIPVRELQMHPSSTCWACGERTFPAC